MLWSTATGSDLPCPVLFCITKRLLLFWISCPLLPKASTEKALEKKKTNTD